MLMLNFLAIIFICMYIGYMKTNQILIKPKLIMNNKSIKTNNKNENAKK